MFSRLATTILIGFSLVNCAGKTSSIRAARTPRDVLEAAATSGCRGACVPAGTEFNVSMDDPIDTRTSFVGQPFAAHLVGDLHAADGRVIATAGSLLTGHVAQLSTGRFPMIRLRFDSIGTVSGGTTLAVSVRDAQRVNFRARDRHVAQPPGGPAFNTAVYVPTFGGPFMNTLGDVGGGYAMPMYVGPPREVRLERSAAILLRLEAPLGAAPSSGSETVSSGD